MAATGSGDTQFGCGLSSLSNYLQAVCIGTGGQAARNDYYNQSNRSSDHLTQKLLLEPTPSKLQHGGFSLFDEMLQKLCHLFKLALANTIEEDVVDGAHEGGEIANHALATRGQAHENASPVVGIFKFLQKSSTAKLADLGGDVGRRELNMISQPTDRYAGLTLSIGRAHEGSELRTGEIHFAPECYATIDQPPEARHHHVEHLTKFMIAIRIQQSSA